jgi:hypothetical protein
MDMTRDDVLSPDSVQTTLLTLRRQLEEPGGWPATANHLLSRLSQAATPRMADEDRHIITVVAREALKGVDISRRYPGFFQRMRTERELRETFLSRLAHLEGPISRR